MRRESKAIQQRHCDTVIALDCLRSSMGALREEHALLYKDAYQLRNQSQQWFIEVRQNLVRQISAATQDLVQKYRREMALRKKFHNELVELRGNIRVFCRVRPVLPSMDTDTEVVINEDAEDDTTLFVSNNGRRMQFLMDRVFGPKSTQEEIFDQVQPLVTSVIDGYNVCIFAYGQTGSGKTFTMMGRNSTNRGINQRAILTLFDVTNSKKPEWNYTISVSMLEIYNEMIR